MAEETLRVEQFPFGIASVGLGTIERRIPADEPPPLPVNAALNVIGKPAHRQDGREKVTGAVRFTVDIKLPGLLHARILRSPLPHARVQAIDAAAAARQPGVRAVLVIAAKDAVLRYVGAPVAAVAARTPAAADAALRLIRVDYAPLPFVVDPDLARRPDAPLVYPAGETPPLAIAEIPVATGLALTGNVRGPDTQGSRGDLAQGFAQAEVIVEGDYRTQTQTHCCMEPHAIVADWRADGLTVWISTQSTAGVREELAQSFGLKLSQVRVKVAAMGGGFGSKSQLGTYGRYAVMLSRQARAPVRLVFDRQEEQLDSGNRPATWQHLRLGARRDGTLTAISLLEYGTAGVGVGAGIGNFAQSLYTCPNFAAAQNDVFINAGRGSAMRGPGNTPGAFAMEQAIDELADKLGLDPLALRERIDPSPVRREERRLGAQRIGWERRHKPGADAGRDQARPRRGAVAVGRQRAEQRRPARCACCATARSRCCPACRTSAPASARCWRRWWPRNSACGPRTSRCASATPIFPPARRRTAAGPPPRSRRPRAPPRGR